MTSISEKRARVLGLLRSEMWKEPSLEEFCVAAQEDPDFSLGPSPASYELLGQITRESWQDAILVHPSTLHPKYLTLETSLTESRTLYLESGRYLSRWGPDGHGYR